MLENEHKVLRFVAKLESKHKEDKDRRFVISYRLSDDTMTIYEPPQRYFYIDNISEILEF